MDEDIYLSLKAGDLNTELCPKLLQVIFDAALNEVQVLTAVRNHENRIIDFRYLLVNKATRIQAGRTELEGQSFIAEYPGAKKTGLFTRLVKVVEMNVVLDETLHYTTPGGTDAWFHIKAHQYEDGLVICRENITGHMIRQATDSPADVIYIANIKSSTITYVSENVKDVFGFDEKHVYETGHNIFIDVIHPEDYVRRMKHLIDLANATDDEPREIEIRLKVRDGNYHWFRLREKMYKKNHDGIVTEAIGRALDIHEQKLKEADSQLQAEDSSHDQARMLTIKNYELELLSTELKIFNTVLATDYRVILRNLYTNLEYIAINNARQLSDSGRANIRRAQSSIQKMNLLAHDAIGYTELYKHGYVSAEVDFNVIVKKALLVFNDKLVQANAKIECEQLPVLQGVPTLLSLLFHHVLNNAIKFRNEFVPPAICIRGNRINGMYINHTSAFPDIWYHVLRIGDNGVGFEPALANKVFDIFSRLHDRNKYNGSGIGLAICKKIMDIHEGFMTVESSPGLGTTVNCFFPIYKE